MVRCAIWYYLYNLKNVKNTHGGVLILVKLQTEAVSATLLKLTILHGCFSRFLNCTNSTKSCHAPHITIQNLKFRLINSQIGTYTYNAAKILRETVVPK